MADRGSAPAVQLSKATLGFGTRRLWTDLDLAVQPGEFLAVLGPNGAGKTSLLKVLLGLLKLTSGTVQVGNATPRRGSDLVGYVPQQRGFDADLGARGRDLVALGADGHRFGRPWSSKRTRELVNAAVAAVGASAYADAPIGKLSGGEQQRLRIAQALISDPALLLCDEPLLSLDLHHQRGVIDLIDARRRDADTAVLMVTHEINPVLPIVDRILYLVEGRWAIGTPDEVMTSQRLSDLYQTEIDVIRVRDRIIVIGAADSVASQVTGQDQTHEHSSNDHSTHEHSTHGHSTHGHGTSRY
jgi:zinc/manganese transport system ATP-binding protein